jgi:WD40 repeat protein
MKKSMFVVVMVGCLFLFIVWTQRGWTTGAARREQRPELFLLTGHKSPLNSVALVGKRAASGDRNGMVCLWDVPTQTVLQMLVGHKGAVWEVVLSPDGRTVASGGQDGTVRLWDAQTGAVKWIVNGHKKGVRSVVFSPDGNTVASGGEDHALRLWDARTGALQQTLVGHEALVRTVIFSPDGKMVASGSADKTVKLWDAQMGQIARTLTGHKHGVRSLAFSLDGAMVASGDEDGRLCVWDAHTGALKGAEPGQSEQKEMPGTLMDGKRQSHPVKSMTFAPDGKKLAWVVGDNGSGLMEKQGDEFVTTGGGSGTVEYGEANVRLSDFIALNDTTIYAFPATLTGHGGEVSSVTFAPDGQKVVIEMDDGTARLWDMRTGALQRTERGQRAQTEGSLQTLLRMLPGMDSVGFSPDGKTLVSFAGKDMRTVGIGGLGEVETGGIDSSIVYLWDVRTGKKRQTLKGHNGWVLSVAFSPDGRTLASGSQDNTVRLWDVRTGRVRRVLTGHHADVNAVIFSPDGKRVVSGGEDGTARLWDARSGQLLATLLILPPTKSGEVSSDWIGFTPEGYYDGSAKAKRFIRWRVGDKLLPAETYEKTFHRPDMVRKALKSR